MPTESPQSPETIPCAEERCAPGNLEQLLLLAVQPHVFLSTYIYTYGKERHHRGMGPFQRFVEDRAQDIHQSCC